MVINEQTKTTTKMNYAFFTDGCDWYYRENRTTPNLITAPKGFYKRDIQNGKVTISGVNTETNTILKNAPITEIEKDIEGNFYVDEAEFIDKTEGFFATNNLMHPMSVSSGVVTSSDIDWENSDFTGWIGDPKDLFRNINSSGGIYNDSTDNPKSFTIKFIRTQQASVFGLGTTIGSFKNARAYMQGSGGASRGLLDASEDSREKQSLRYKNEVIEFNSFTIEFLTEDRIDLSNIFIKDAVTSRITGFTHKFGLNPDIDLLGEEDVWDIGDLYVFTTTPQPYYISSASATDTQEIEVNLILFDGTYLREYNTEVTLNGQNKVEIPTPYPCWAVNRAYNNNSEYLTGQVYIYEDTTITGGIPNDLSYVRASIRVGYDQTEMAVFTVPHYTSDGLQVLWAEIYKWEAKLAKNKDCSAVAALKIAEQGKVFRTRDSGAITSSVAAGSNFGTEMPLTCRPGADILIRVSEVSANDVSISGGFTLKTVTF